MANLLGFSAMVLGAVLLAQQPQIQNGTVETRQVARLGQLSTDIAAIAKTATAPTWIGWREPAATSLDNACCILQWNDEPLQRGCGVEPAPTDANGRTIDTPRPAFAPPSGPVKLEAGTSVLILVRIADHAVERVRSYADDCPLDAGGRSVIWLEGVSAAESVAYLNSLVSLHDVAGTPTDIRRRLNSSAIAAIGWHKEAAADTLIALAKQNTDSPARTNAFNALGRSTDPKTMAFIEQILAREKSEQGESKKQ